MELQGFLMDRLRRGAFGEGFFFVSRYSGTTGCESSGRRRTGPVPGEMLTEEIWRNMRNGEGSGYRWEVELRGFFEGNQPEARKQLPVEQFTGKSV